MAKKRKSDQAEPVEIAGMKLYTVKVLAKKFGLSETAIRRHLTKGRIKGTKIGHVWYVSESQLRSMFEE